MMSKNRWFNINNVPIIEDEILLVANKRGFLELVYIDGETKKPWRFDSDDRPTLSIDQIEWWMWVEVPDMDLGTENNGIAL